MYFSRCHAVTGEIGASLALWWRVRAEVVGSLDVAGATAALQAILPDDVRSAVISMRPKGKVPEASEPSRDLGAEGSHTG